VNDKNNINDNINKWNIINIKDKKEEKPNIVLDDKKTINDFFNNKDTSIENDDYT
jgi:hypothetical protein